LLQKIGIDIGDNKFMNCCVLLLTIYDEEEEEEEKEKIKISLIYDGNLIKPDKYTYYKNTESTNVKDKIKYTKFIEVTSGKNIKLKEYFNLTKYDSNTTYNFYIVINGDSDVSDVSILNKDPSLTKEGEEQANLAGISLNNLLINKKIINYVFVSDLQRTRQTMIELLKKINDKMWEINPIMIVLPCAHELIFVKGYKCDGDYKQKVLGLFSYANTSKCDRKIKDPEPDPDPLCPINEDEGNHIIVWKYYNEFYDGTRNKTGQTAIIKDKTGIIISPTVKHCRDTDMIILILDFINEWLFTQPGFKRVTPKSRKRIPK